MTNSLRAARRKYALSDLSQAQGLINRAREILKLHGDFSLVLPLLADAQKSVNEVQAAVSNYLPEEAEVAPV